MAEGSIAQFIEKLADDDELRRKVIDAERTARDNAKRDLGAIAQIASEAGCDISGWSARPRAAARPSDEELKAFGTCCLVLTSTI
jgi:hypothetical protein